MCLRRHYEFIPDSSVRKQESSAFGNKSKKNNDPRQKFLENFWTHKVRPDKFDWIEFEQPTKFARSKFEWPKASLKGELQDVIRNAGPQGETHGWVE